MRISNKIVLPFSLAVLGLTVSFSCAAFSLPTASGSAGISVADQGYYTWAHDNGITTMSLANANIKGPIERYELAKMLSVFYTNVIGGKITHNPACDVTHFADSTGFNAELKKYIQDVCDMGLMGWNLNKTALLKNFMPYGVLSAKDFSTVIGRYASLAGIKYNPNFPPTITRGDVFRFLKETAGFNIKGNSAAGTGSATGGTDSIIKNIFGGSGSGTKKPASSSGATGGGKASNGTESHTSDAVNNLFSGFSAPKTNTPPTHTGGNGGASIFNIFSGGK